MSRSSAWAAHAPRHTCGATTATSAPQGRRRPRRIRAMKILRRLGSELGVLVLWLVHFLPMRWIGAIGAGLGWLLYHFGRGRVTRVNLGLCFPDMPEAERHAL